MLKGFGKKFLAFIVYIPGMSILSRLVYRYAQKKIIKEYSNHPEIRDILLTSKLNSPDFLYGKSDLNFILIVNELSHPKTILKQFREFIKSNWATKLAVNTVYVPIVSEEELQTELVLFYLTRSTYQDQVEWYSLFKEKKILFNFSKDQQYYMCSSSMQSLDHFLLKGFSSKKTRSLTKNIYWPIMELSKHYPQVIRSSKSLTRTFSFLQNFILFSTLFKKQFIKNAWETVLISHKPNQEAKQGNFHSPHMEIDARELKYFDSLLELDFIDNIYLTPSLIKNSSKNTKGKIFVDLIVNENLLQSGILNRLENLREGFKELEYSSVKYRLRFISQEIYQLQLEEALFAFPLEALYRESQSHSLIGTPMKPQYHKKTLRKACQNFFIIQFMRFRSLEQKTDLIGSKFIKSLNLMYKYYLVLSYLKEGKVKFESHHILIRKHLTPQFSDLKLDHIVTEEDWNLIRSQLIYFLKHIREELVKTDSSLKNLKF